MLSGVLIISENQAGGFGNKYSPPPLTRNMPFFRNMELQCMFIALQIKLNYKNEKCQSSKFNGKSAVWKGLKTKKTKKSNFNTFHLSHMFSCFQACSLNIFKGFGKNIF